MVGAVAAEKYRVIRELGRGAFGVVFEVEHLHIPGQRLALKALHGDLARDADLRKRFIREVQVALRLVHPNIVPIRDCSATDDLTYYTMDFVEGRPLDKVLEQEGPIPWPRALEWTRQAALALAAAHAEKIVHRDMKPANMILTTSSGHDVVKVLDFGIAKITEQSSGLTRGEGAIVGTPEYLSPEQAQGKKAIDARADIYSLGVVLYHLLTGRLPFRSETLTGFIFQHAFEPPPPFAGAAPDLAIPAEVEALVRKALEKDPAARFQSAREMIAAMTALLESASTGVLSPGAGASLGGVVTGRTRRPGPAAPAAEGAIDWDAPLPGQRLEKYRLVRVLGKGGFGVVCEATHVLMGRRVAVKLLRPELGDKSGFTERFRREAQITASLQHPNLITIHDYGETPEACYIVMEYVEGGTLADLIRQRGRTPPAEALEVLRPALEAIAVAHAHNVVHRDLKPGNIMISGDGRVKVLDFGIAKIAGGDARTALTAQGAIIGSAHYISPEQVLGLPVDARTDLYAMGCIVFEMLTGRVPFVREGTADYFRAHAKEPPPRLRDVWPAGAFPEALEALVARLLEKDPARRFPGARELLAAFEAAVRAPAPPRSSLTEQWAGSLAAETVVGPGPAAAPPAVTATAPGRRTSSDERTLAASPPPGALAAPVPTGNALGSTARLELLDPPRTCWFLFGAPRLRFGRAKPGTGGSQNELVLRLLPCRSAALDPENFARTNEISGQHGELIIQGGAALFVDRSSHGTWLDGARLGKGVAMRLPDAFRLSIARVLDLEGRIFPGGGRVEAVRLRRIGNREQDVYVWIPVRAETGPQGAIDLPLPAGEVRLDGGALVLAAGGRAAPLSAGDLVLGGARCRAGTAGPADQVDRG